MRRNTCLLPLVISLLWTHIASAHPDPQQRAETAKIIVEALRFACGR